MRGALELKESSKTLKKCMRSKQLLGVVVSKGVDRNNWSGGIQSEKVFLKYAFTDHMSKINMLSLALTEKNINNIFKGNILFIALNLF